jgi:uncharacterized membrane protein YeiB
MNPTELSKRIDILDYLRGFALLGIILVNILPLLSVKLPVPHSMDASYQQLLYLFVEGRFYPIFSFLFGIGFYLFISRANARGENGYLLFLRRILALFVFGFVHLLFQPGEALTVYASCGLLVLPFYKVNKEVNLVLGVLLLIITAIFAVKVFMTLPLILLGLAAGQYQVFENIAPKRRNVAIFTVIMFVLSITGLICQYRHMPNLPFARFVAEKKSNSLQMVSFLHLGITAGPFIAAFYVGMLILLLQFSVIQKVLSPLKSYGRMALTNYVMQTALILTAGKLFNLFGQITHLQSMYVCLAIYAIQLIFSVTWLRLFNFGPLEWIWRMVTYRKAPPML